ncbi:MAG: hypothetical protein K2L56_07455, partial [Prevotella sp.]|nr:hypothetical protein [Prevotella sp.]
PFIDKALEIHSIHLYQFGLFNDMMLMKVVPYDFGKHGLARTGFAHYYGIYAQSDISHIRS